MKLRYYPGKALPLGAHVVHAESKAVQFSIFSKHAERVWLDFFAHENDSTAEYSIELKQPMFKTGDYWHVTVEGIEIGQLYAYRMAGEYRPEEALYYNAGQSLLDPYARSLAYPQNYAERRTEESHSSGSIVPKCVVIDDSFNWQGDSPLNISLKDSIIYEAHVRGFTKHSSSQRLGVKNPGSYAGIVDTIPYLKELGITSLELLPIQEFDEFEYSYRKNPQTGEALKNYWGYSTIAFFAPKAGYALGSERGAAVHECKTMIRELHKAGIEVILDIVFNHSGEGDARGKTFSFRGIDNAVYYMTEEGSGGYKNYSGCGNTLNCNNSVVQKLILDSLHYWVEVMHVDGFRFDLASILTRNEAGHLHYEHSVLDRISRDPLLQNTKIIAEAWDAAGAYQVGQLQGRWCEWNDRFRDDVKRFWLGHEHTLSAFATRLSGSADLYTGRGSEYSINYVTAHDGFTLNDLLSYSEKRNEANGENNRDGSNHEFNRDLKQEELRSRMVKNMLATILISQGTPMLLAGDEMRRSQQGNNNAYCQDNEISWLNFELLSTYSDVHRFLKQAIQLRKQYCRGALKKIEWFSENGTEVQWNSKANVLACRMQFRKPDSELYIMCNASSKNILFTMPPALKNIRWKQALNTAHSDREYGANSSTSIPQSKITLVNRSLIVLCN